MPPMKNIYNLISDGFSSMAHGENIETDYDIVTTFTETNLRHYDIQIKSKNPNAIELLRENTEKINWYMLLQNPNAIEIIRENPEKINWNYLSLNKNGIELLKKKKYII
jgi:hypothetical protein